MLPFLLDSKITHLLEISSYFPGCLFGCNNSVILSQSNLCDGQRLLLYDNIAHKFASSHLSGSHPYKFSLLRNLLAS